MTALVPYKRVDLAIEAFNRLGKPLLIVGDGQGMNELKKRAKKNIEFLGWQNDEKVRDYYQGCRALIFPGKEDFGISPCGGSGLRETRDCLWKRGHPGNRPPLSPGETDRPLFRSAHRLNP